MLLFVRPFTPGGDLQLMCALQAPDSRGTISITSSDPRATPVIRYHYLRTEHDRRRLRHAIRTAAELLRAGLGRRTAPPGDVLGNDRALDGWIAEHLTTAVHLCGSAAIGSVVDEQLRVCGVPGLRIADTSVLPVVPRRGTSATAVAVGEKAAALDPRALVDVDAVPARVHMLAQVINPFLAPSPLPFGFPDFDAIREEHFRPAFEAGMAEQRAEVDAITADPQPPTFENTLVALERSGATLRRVSAVFFTLVGSCSTPGIRDIEAEMAPRLAAHADAITLDAELFARIDALFDRAARARAWTPSRCGCSSTGTATPCGPAPGWARPSRIGCGR